MTRKIFYVTFAFLLVMPVITSLFAQEAKKSEKLSVTSSAFKEGSMIPKTYTCDGKNISPPVGWTAVPSGTKSIAVIVDDPDAPGMVFVHWVVYNLPPDTRSLPESQPADKILRNGAKQGMNDFLKIGFGGFCPPTGTHRYYIKVYALDTVLDLEPGLTKQHVVNAMQGHILAEGQLMGKYKR